MRRPTVSDQVRGALLVAFLLWWLGAFAEIASEPIPYLLRFEERDGLLRLPDGVRMVVPRGSELLIEPPVYFPSSITIRAVPIDETVIHRDGFEG